MKEANSKDGKAVKSSVIKKAITCEVIAFQEIEYSIYCCR